MQVEFDHTWNDIYEYYFRKGMKLYIMNSISSIMIASIVTFAPLFLFNCIQWQMIGKEDTLSKIILPFWKAWSNSGFITKICTIVFFVFTLFLVFQLLLSLPRFASLQKYYEKTLGIKDEDLSVIEWSEVVDSIVICDPQRSVSILGIAQQIMKIDNFLCALVSDPSALTWRIPIINATSQIPYTEFFVYLLKLSLSGIVFDAKGDSLVSGAQSIKNGMAATKLQNRFRLIGIVLIIFLPFTLAFELLYIFFSYAEAIRTSPNSISNRKWTVSAKWQVRDFNELPHIFEKRIISASEYANFYLDDFKSEIARPILRAVSFICGAIIGCILVIGLLTDISMVLGLKIYGDKTIAWLIAVLAGVYAISSTTDVVPINKPQLSTEELLSELENRIHYDFKDDNNSPKSWQTMSSVAGFFQPQWQQVLSDLVSALLNPLFFFIVLPLKASSIIDFVKRNSIYKDDIGWMCSFSAFSETEINRFDSSPNHKQRMKKSYESFNQQESKQIRTENSEDLIQSAFLTKPADGIEDENLLQGFESLNTMSPAQFLVEE